MIHHKQTVEHAPDDGRFGDCERACLASVLNLPIEQVPHFRHDNPSSEEGWRRKVDWLAGYGMAMIVIPLPGELALESVLEYLRIWTARAPLILAGTSALGCGHWVVIVDGEIANDPSGNGLAGPLDGHWHAIILTVSLECRPAPLVEPRLAPNND